IGVHELQTLRDSVEPRLNRGITDPEGLFHFFDRAMAADECHDKNLIFEAQPRQLREFETAFDRDVFFGKPDPLNDHALALSQLRQLLPIACGGSIRRHSKPQLDSTVY